jgi:hypothetical protein
MLLYLDLAIAERKAEGRLTTDEDVTEAIVDGAARRLRPKLMTVATAFFGLLPVMFQSAAGSEIMRHMAAPMIGGLTISFLLELLIYPVLYQKLIAPTPCSTGTLSPAVLRERPSVIPERVEVVSKRTGINQVLLWYRQEKVPLCSYGRDAYGWQEVLWVLPGILTAELGHRLLLSVRHEMARRLGAAFRENRLPHAMKMFTQPRLLIVDEIGYFGLDQAGAACSSRSSAAVKKRGPPLSLPISYLLNQSEILTNGSKRTALLIYYLDDNLRRS